MSARLSVVAQGTLDASFGTAGIVTTDVAQVDAAVTGSVALQPDGKIVVVGDSGASLSTITSIVIRCMPDGSLDSTFGSGGKVTLAASQAFGVAIQADGKIVVVGVTTPGRQAMVVRLEADGSPDAGFGSSGTVTTGFGGSGADAEAVVVQT